MPSDPTPPPISTAVDRFAAPRRLHPASILLGIDLRQLIQAMVFPVAASLAAGRMAVTITMLVAFAILGLAARIAQWKRLIYSFDGEVFRLDAGVIRRTRRAMDVARIQQVELDRTPVDRLLGFATLRIETAVLAGEAEVELRVLPLAEAQALREAVRASKRQAASAAAPSPDDGSDTERPTRVLTVPLRHVALASVTGSRLLVFPAVVLGALQLFRDATGGELDPGAVARLLAQAGLVVTLLVGVPAAFAVALVVGVVRDGGFRIDRVGDDLHVGRGLLTTRESIVPLRRVQLVEVRRNWLRRALGYATVRVHSAGGSDAADRRVLVPLVAEGTLPRLLPELLGAPVPADLDPHPRPALRRALFRWVRDLGVLAAAAWLLPFVPQGVRWTLLALVPVGLVLGVVEYRQLGHRADHRLLAARRGAIAVTTSYAPLHKVQAVTRRASPFQRRLRLSTVRIHVAGPGGGVEVLDAGDSQADEVVPLLVAHSALRPAVGRAGSGDTSPHLSG